MNYYTKGKKEGELMFETQGRGKSGRTRETGDFLEKGLIKCIKIREDSEVGGGLLRSSGDHGDSFKA